MNLDDVQQQADKSPVRRMLTRRRLSVEERARLDADAMRKRRERADQRAARMQQRDEAERSRVRSIQAEAVLATVAHVSLNNPPRRRVFYSTIAIGLMGGAFIGLSFVAGEGHAPSANAGVPEIGAAFYPSAPGGAYAFKPVSAFGMPGNNRPSLTESALLQSAALGDKLDKVAGALSDLQSQVQRLPSKMTKMAATTGAMPPVTSMVMAEEKPVASVSATGTGHAGLRFEDERAKVKTFTARRGASLRSVICTWANSVHVECAWQAEVDYELAVDVKIDGTFEHAVSVLLEAFAHLTPHPYGVLRLNEALQTPALVVTAVGNPSSQSR
jgi:hypothetical protein